MALFKKSDPLLPWDEKFVNTPSDIPSASKVEPINDTASQIIRKKRRLKRWHIVVLIIFIILLVITFVLYLSRGRSTFSIIESAADETELAMIPIAQNFSCPFENNIYKQVEFQGGRDFFSGMGFSDWCFTHEWAENYVKKAKEEENSWEFDWSSIVNDIHSEVKYLTTVGRGFPGDFYQGGFSDNSFWGADEVTTTYWDKNNQPITQAVCQAMLPENGYVVQMYLEDDDICPLCGRYKQAERRVYFNGQKEPVCQAIYESFGSMS